MTRLRLIKANQQSNSKMIKLLSECGFYGHFKKMDTNMTVFNQFTNILYWNHILSAMSTTNSAERLQTQLKAFVIHLSWSTPVENYWKQLHLLCIRILSRFAENTRHQQHQFNFRFCVPHCISFALFLAAFLLHSLILLLPCFSLHPLRNSFQLNFTFSMDFVIHVMQSVLLQGIKMPRKYKEKKYG